MLTGGWVPMGLRKASTLSGWQGSVHTVHTRLHLLAQCDSAQ